MRRPLRWFILMFLLLGAQPGAGAERCNGWSAMVISVQGAVELRPAGATAWHSVRQNDAICRGDSIRVGDYGRAAVLLPDPDRTVIRLDAHSSMAFSEPEDGPGSLLEVLKGWIHVISRDPRFLRFSTPFANAGLEGTEFVIAVDQRETQITVIEGEVLLSNGAGELYVPSGQVAVARSAQAPSASPAPRPVDAARWARYYLPILADSRHQPAPDQAPGNAERADPDFYSGRAARRLEIGRVDEAVEDLDRARGLEPDHAEALALQAVVALARHQLDTALAMARQAVASAPRSAPALIALSHAQQARFDLAGAQDSLERAVVHAPANALAWARLAEVRLSRGRIEAGVLAAETAVILDPALGHAQTVLGFAYLVAERQPAAAEDAFRQAIALDQVAPLPRLGLALALGQQGRPVDSREQMEIAVLLDPGHALARSYMAKIYHDEHRDGLTQSQLDLARLFDPLDPTPWLYDALRKQGRNRPVEALRDLRHAVGLNANRPVYRSTMRLDEDLMARSAGIGRLHRELGFTELALEQAWRLNVTEPGEYAGHRQLADLYSLRPRHEIARIHEVHQSQMLQPANVTPIPPQLAEANVFIMDMAGPSELAFTEFSPLMHEKGFGFEASAVGGASGTRGESLVLAGLHDRVSYSVGHLGFRTDGFRANNDLDQRVTNAFVQVRPNARTSVQAELRATKVDKGHLRMLFDETNFIAILRQVEEVNVVRAGIRRELSDRSRLLVSGTYEDAKAATDTTVRLESQADGYGLDIQHLYQGERWRFTSGASYMSQRSIDTSTPSPASPFSAHDVVPPLPQDQAPPPPTQDGLLVLSQGEFGEQTAFNIGHLNVYGYGVLPISDTLLISAGGSLSSMKGHFMERSMRLYPKLGLMWDATPSTVVRAAIFRTLQAPFVSRHNIQPRLEPTHVSGFNQFFFGAEGEDAWRHGLSVDHRLSANLYAGLELSRRDLDAPTVIFDSSSLERRVEHIDIEEFSHRTYLYWTPARSVSLSAEYQYERFDNDGTVLAGGFSKLRTERLPVKASYFHPSGFSTAVKAAHVRQEGDFQVLPSFPGMNATERGADRFWVLDLSMGYRLPRRRGLLALNVHNVLDREFRFQDTDPENPRIIPQRLVSFRFTVAY